MTVTITIVIKRQHINRMRFYPVASLGPRGVPRAAVRGPPRGRRGGGVPMTAMYEMEATVDINALSLLSLSLSLSMYYIYIYILYLYT